MSQANQSNPDCSLEPAGNAPVWLRFRIPSTATQPEDGQSSQAIASVTYNLLEVLDRGTDATGMPALTPMKTRLVAAANASDTLNSHDANSPTAKTLQAAKEDVEAANKRLSLLEQRAKQFAGIASEAAVARVAGLQADIDTQMTSIRGLEVAQDAAETADQAVRGPLASALSAALAGLPGVLQNLPADERGAWATAYLGGTISGTSRIFQVRHVGAVLVGTDVASFPYQFRYGVTPVDLALEPVGHAAAPTQNDRLYLHVVDRIPANGSYDLYPTLIATPGEPQNSDPWRTPFNLAPAGELTAGVIDAFTDQLFNLKGPYRGNDKLKLEVKATVAAPVKTIESTTTTGANPSSSSTTKISTADKSVTLLSTELPSVHPLYRWQFVTGAVLSFLPEQKGVRELTGVTTTTGKNVTTTTAVGPNGTTVTTVETPTSTTTKTYADRLTIGGRRALGFAGFGGTLKRKDPMNRWSPRELYNPAITLSFGLPDPGDNILLGLSHEIQRNVQLFWGVHFGRVESLRGRPFDDPTDSSAPPVYKGFRHNWFVGTALNVNAIARIFKLGI
jgi:hypothetical protein